MIAYIILLIVIVCNVMEYFLHLRDLKVNYRIKMVVMILDTLHHIFVFSYMYLIVGILTGRLGHQYLYLLNCVALGLIIMYIIFRRCVLSMIADRLLRYEDRPWNMWFERIYNHIMYDDYMKKTDEKPDEIWLKGNMIQFIICFLLNFYEFVRK